jgi:polysaccharide export outer membrane protein
MLIVTVGVNAAALAGCVAERTSDPAAAAVFRPAGERDVSATEYRVAPPDKLTLRAAGVKELDQFVTQIRPDGKISINLIGEVYVVGRTPAELSATLTAAANRYYNGVSVQVEVTEYASKFYEVFGTAARTAGRKPFTGRNTVIAALAEAGFTEDAWPQQVSVSRPARDGHERATAIIDMKQMYLYGDTRQNYLLEENDIIYVPDSPLAALSKDARKVLGPITGIGGAAGSVQPASR